ncbi:MAG: hypothetical protein AAF432_03300 [Planctomycetota bacterium]
MDRIDSMVMRGHSSRHRGQALLVVLGILMLIMPLASSVASLSTSLKLRVLVDEHTRFADDLLIAAHDPIVHWLRTDGASVVLPPSSLIPTVEVMHDTWIDNGRPSEIQIRAWDQRGVPGVTLAQQPGPLQNMIPEHVLEAVRDIEFTDDAQVGLDMVHMAMPTVVVFPQAENTANEAAIGAHVATHNGALRDPGAINVSTAPMPLVERVLLLSGRGGEDLIHAARSAGEVPAVPAMPNSSNQNTQRRLPQLVAGSDTWAFRVDIRAGVVHRSWWLVYRAQRGRSWTCIQRIPIHE